MDFDLFKYVINPIERQQQQTLSGRLFVNSNVNIKWVPVLSKRNLYHVQIYLTHEHMPLN